MISEKIHIGDSIQTIFSGALQMNPQAIGHESAHRALIDRDAAMLTAKRAELEARQQAGIADGMHPEARAAVELNNQKLADQEFHKFAQEIKGKSAEQRTALLRASAANNARAEALDTLLGETPKALLSLYGLEDARRAAIGENIRRCGNETLTRFAAVAVATGDKHLAAEILTRLEGIFPLSKRPFSAENFARRMCGPEFEAIKKSLKGIKELHRQMLARESQFNFPNPRKASREKITSGLAKMKAEAD
jgi:hypothetical protein